VLDICNGDKAVDFFVEVGKWYFCNEFDNDFDIFFVLVYYYYINLFFLIWSTVNIALLVNDALLVNGALLVNWLLLISFWWLFLLKQFLLNGDFYGVYIN
jgi:hypothetical protein